MKNKSFSSEIGKCFEQLGENADCRAIVLSGSGKHFTAGIDLQDAMKLGSEIAEHVDIARKAKIVKSAIQQYQNTLTALEKVKFPN